MKHDAIQSNLLSLCWTCHFAVAKVPLILALVESSIYAATNLFPAGLFRGKVQPDLRLPVLVWHRPSLGSADSRLPVHGIRPPY